MNASLINLWINFQDINAENIKRRETKKNQKWNLLLSFKFDTSYKVHAEDINLGLRT